MHKTTSFGQLIGDRHPRQSLLDISGGGYYTTQSNATCTLAMVTSAVTVSEGLRYGGLNIECSFSAAPTVAAALTVKDYAGTTVWSVDILTANPPTFNLDDRLLKVGTGYLVTLGAGGAGSSGKLNVSYKIMGNKP